MEFDSPQAERDFYLKLEKSDYWRRLEEFLADRESELITLMEDPKQKKNVLIGRLIEVRFFRTLPKALAQMSQFVPVPEEKQREIVRSNLGIPDSITGLI